VLLACTRLCASVCGRSGSRPASGAITVSCCALGPPLCACWWLKRGCQGRALAVSPCLGQHSSLADVVSCPGGSLSDCRLTPVRCVAEPVCCDKKAPMGVDGFLDKKIQSANDKTQVRALLHVRVCYRSTRYRAELSPVLRGWTKLDWLTILLCPCNVAIRTCLLTLFRADARKGHRGRKGETGQARLGHRRRGFSLPHPVVPL